MDNLHVLDYARLSIAKPKLRIAGCVPITADTISRILEPFRAHPESAGSILLNIHRISDIYLRNRTMYPTVVALDSQDDSVWVTLCRPGSTLPDQIIDLVLQNEFCGVSKDAFLTLDSPAVSFVL